MEFTIPGETVPWARAGAHGKHRFTPAKQRNFMGALKDYASVAMRGRKPFDCAIELSVMAVYGWPKSWSNRRRSEPTAMWKTSRPDADNIVKIVKDALNTVAFTDDAVVASQHVWKQYGEIPRLVVRIAPIAA